jgi:hypothetical protein
VIYPCVDYFHYRLGSLTGTFSGLGDPIEDGANKKIEFRTLDGGEQTAAPEYLTIQARTSDATCISCE